MKSIPSCLTQEYAWLKYVRSSMSDKQTEPPKQLSVRENDKPVQSALEFLNPDWIKVYIAIAENGKDWIRKNMEIVADHDGGVLYHCMTGKDRTGLFTAMLLRLCNAYPADIIADYSVSQVNLRPFYLSMMKFPEMLDENGEPDLTKGFYQTRPETMYEFLRFIDATYGNMRAYLSSCDIPEATLQKNCRKPYRRGLHGVMIRVRKRISVS